jgi:CheY-like chemotaxis protein
MKIVILDDSLTIRMTVEALLEDLGVKEEEIYSFDDGQEALKFILNCGADIIFSDINMPKMTGCVFAQKLFEQCADLKKSFFVMSGEESNEQYTKMRSIGAKRFIKKPIDSEYFNHFIAPEIQKRRAFEELLNA